MTTFMSEQGVRQASLAVLDGTKLAYARGYDLQEPGLLTVSSTSTFRLASVSKVVTAAEILLLVDRNELALTDTAAGVLGVTATTNTADATAFNAITVQNLLQHQFPSLGGTQCLRSGFVFGHRQHRRRVRDGDAGSVRPLRPDAPERGRGALLFELRVHPARPNYRRQAGRVVRRRDHGRPLHAARHHPLPRSVERPVFARERGALPPRGAADVGGQQPNPRSPSSSIRSGSPSSTSR